MNEKEFIEMSIKLSKNLGILSQYILILVPFICKFIVKTIKEIKKQNRTCDCENAMNSGFWNEEMEIFGNCLDKMRHRELNNNATNELSKKRLYSEDDECQAIEEIMNALDRNKLNIKFLQSKGSFSILIDKWATDIAKFRKDKSEEDNFNQNLKDPISYFVDNYNFVSKKQNAKVNRMKDVIEEMLKNIKESDELYKYFESLLSNYTDENKIFKVVLKDLEKSQKDSPVSPLLFSNENVEVHHSDSYESPTNSVDLNESFSEKVPIIGKSNIDVTEFPTSKHSKDQLLKIPDSKIGKHSKDQLLKIPDSKIEKHSKGQLINIPSSKIGKSLGKHVSLSKKKSVVAKPVENPMMFKKKEVDDFSNLKTEILKKRSAKLRREKYKKIDLSERIKLKQKSFKK